MRSGLIIITAATLIGVGAVAVPATGDPLPAGRYPQTITIAPITDTTVDQVVSVDASSSSGLPVDITVTGACTMQDIPGGRVVVATAAGVCTVHATQDGDDRWLPAPPVEQLFSFFGGQAGSMIQDSGPGEYLAAHGLPLVITVKVLPDDPEGRMPTGSVIAGLLPKAAPLPQCSLCGQVPVPILPDGSVTLELTGADTANLNEGRYAMLVSYPGDEFYRGTELTLDNILIVPPGVAVEGKLPIVVSLGDSYISGEGGRWAGNAVSLLTAWRTDVGDDVYNDVKGGESIKGCHRSDMAEIHIDQAGADVRSVNLACSGAETTTMYESGDFKPGIDFYMDAAAQRRGQAIELYRLASANPGRVKMVVLSIGGNDFQFGDIVQTCVEDFLGGEKPCSTRKSILDLFDSANVERQQMAITKAVQRVNTAMIEAGYSSKDWTLLQQGYPSPVPSQASDIRYGEGYRRQIVGGCGMYNADMKYANDTALGTINDTVRRAGEIADLPNVRFLDLTEAYHGKRLCEEGVDVVGPFSKVKYWKDDGALMGSEWVAAIRGLAAFGMGWPYQLQESLHPNYWGQLANQVCVKLAWNEGNVQGGSCQRGDGAYPKVEGTPRQYPVMVLVAS